MRISSQLAGLFALFWVAYIGMRCVYNLFFHPLRKILGPWMAAMTSLPDFCGTYEVEKDLSTVAGLGVPASAAATISYALHRSRRGYMNPYFSKTSIKAMEPLFHERITALLGRLDRALPEDKRISLDKAFSAMTADIITQRFFGYHYDYLSVPDLVFPIKEAFQGASEIFHWTRFVPWAVKYLNMLPLSVIRSLFPSVATLLELQKEIGNKIIETRGNKDEGKQKSVIMQALSDESIPKSERTMQRLLDEGQRALSVGMFYLLSDRSLIRKLRAELSQVAHIPEMELITAKLEPLPYLTGVVKESIRLSYGPLTHLPRVFVDKTLQYGKYSIPPGMPMSQSTYFVHNNPEIFPNPLKFAPERWVEAAEKGIPLNNWLTSFTKGSRQCLGIGLAHAEMYLTFARVIRNFDMELENTTANDVSINSVLIMGQSKPDKNGGPGQGEVEVMMIRKLEA
ncbi:hypothetical protein COCCADRAFT_41910 [Bipolaris zeicola 26-R-13]|uniref:Cytochrome P450 n=1 Tax=Cochliobolus carbonum (strain 26-R-13) TaxID=930089 RepID=W6XPZ3_COCC2|nr:uncharacterized protein COCCADRAFT_41910 [Bipolaris zeicola 26-R-13]EUC27340.1 hypothetical protein COCCADRAFT_41910 [Bipolaris zeicola 26-R-13]